MGNVKNFNVDSSDTVSLIGFVVSSTLEYRLAMWVSGAISFYKVENGVQTEIWSK